MSFSPCSHFLDPLGYRNHDGLSIFFPGQLLFKLPVQPGVSSSSTWLDALWLCFYGSLTHISLYILFIHMSSTLSFLLSLRPETISYSHLNPRAQWRISLEGVINLGSWPNQQDGNTLFVCSQSLISGSMNEDRSSWGRVDLQKLTDILSRPPPSWPYSPLSASSAWHTPLYSSPWQEGLWSSEGLSGADQADRGGSWVASVPGFLVSLRHLGSERLPQSQVVQHLSRCLCTSDALGVRCLSEPEFWYLVYMFVFMVFLLMWL